MARYYLSRFDREVTSSVSSFDFRVAFWGALGAASYYLVPRHSKITILFVHAVVVGGAYVTQASRHASQLRELYRTSLRELKRLKETSGIAAGVYTQTTDVEGEINGLLTYDRKVSRPSFS
jgi:phage gp36-like protein